MATDIILRSVKASALSHAEMDQNWQSLAVTVDIHTSSATIAVTDQNKIIETDISSGTMTLPTVSNAAGTDTDSFRVTVKNINASSVIVDGNGAETIEGAASVVLLQYEAAEFTLDGAGTGWTVASFFGPTLLGVTASKAELNIMDGVTSTTAELNILDGVTSTAAELNILDGVTSTAAELNYNDITTAGTAQASKSMVLDGSKGITGITSLTSTALIGTTVTGTTVNASTTLQIGGANVTSTAAELNILDGVTSTAAELNILDGVTSTAAELNILDGVTATATELNLMDGVTSTTTELNYTDGVTSAIQTQLNAKQPLDADLTAIAALANTNSNFIVGNGSAWVAETGATARTSLGVDVAGTDNSTDVTLAGTPNYITISGQIITRNSVDMAADITGVLPAGNLGTNAVTTVKINALAVTEAKIAALAVTVGKLAANAVTRAKISTATVSAAGSLAGTVLITMNAYSFFPMIHVQVVNTKESNYDEVALTMMAGHTTDGASADSPRFSLSDGIQAGNNTYDVDYRYIQA